jgi:acylpyruvate hydrolase
VTAVLEAGLGATAETGASPVALVEADLAPVVTRPSKIICLGLNYKAHIEEMQGELPSYPTLFAKFATALTGPRDPIVLPKASKAVDWEAELGFVIGRRVRNASLVEALEAIAGYTIVNDVSMRDWQWRTSEWLQGKTWECCTPVGPALVSPEEVDHAADLLLRCEVDGAVMQEARTSDLLFKPAEIVQYVSEILTLDPGDLISTGTPAGVGAGRQPPVFLRPGNVMRTSIEGLGELVNECVAEEPG